jgi:hypothetical protein
MTVNDTAELKNALTLAIKEPTDHNVGLVIKAMRKNAPNVPSVMNSLPKGDAAKISGMIDAFWSKGIRL